MAQQIQIRRDTAANWSSANPILAQGEMGLETNTLKVKFGDGVTAWNSLAYFGNSIANSTDVTLTSLVSGNILIANASLIFINKSLSSLVNEYVSFSSLGSLAVMNQLSFTSLTNQPSLSSLAFQATIDYSTSQIINKPSLGSLAPLNDLSYTSLLNLPSLGSLSVLNDLSYTSLLNLPSLGSLAVMNQLSFLSLTNQPSLSSLAYQSTIDYTTSQITNKPALGSLAVMNQLSFTSLTNQPSLGSLAFGNNVVLPLVLSGTTLSLSQASIVHNNLGGLTTGDPHTQYALLAGRSGGQTLYGGTGSGDDLYIHGTSNAVKGDIFLNWLGGRTLVGATNSFTGNENFKAYKSTATSAGDTNAVFIHNKTVAGGFNYGIYNNVDVSVTTGTTDSVQGFFNYVNNSNLGTINFVEAFTQRIDNTGSGAIGEASNIKIFTPTSNGTISNLYGIYIEDQNGTGIVNGYSIYSDGGEMFHRDPIQIGNFTPTAPVAYLDVRQLSTTATYPTLRLEQSDLSEEFIQFQTTIGAGNPIVASSTATTFSHKIRVSVNGTFKFLYAYNG